MYAIVARWHAQPGTGDEVAALLSLMQRHVREEPGCRLYACNRDPEDPDRFLLYEQYDDAAAFQAHLETVPFQEIVRERILPLLAHREREVWETL